MGGTFVTYCRWCGLQIDWDEYADPAETILCDDCKDIRAINNMLAEGVIDE